MAPRTELDAAIEDFALALSLLVRRIRAHAPPEFAELPWTQKAVLKRLEQAGPATTADLARAEGIKPQSMAAVLASLEELKLIAREAHPTDGRQVNIALTAKGSAMRRNLKAAKHAWLNRAFAQLARQEQATLFKAGAIIKRLAEMR